MASILSSRLPIRKPNSSSLVGNAPQYREFMNPTKFDSFSGADIQCAIRIPNKWISEEVREVVGNGPIIKNFAELQTLSFSSARSVFPVRRLGESDPVSYTRGGRTHGGTLVFSVFNRDVFYEIYRLAPKGEVFSQTSPFFVDQLPEFDIIINACNEHGALSSMLLVGVTLTNMGSTLSIHDLFVEASYTWVARYMFPFGERPLAMDKVKDALKTYRAALSSEAEKSLTDAPETEIDDIATVLEDYYAKVLRGGF